MVFISSSGMVWFNGNHLIVVILSISSVVSYKCERTANVCQTSLTIQQYLTMTHPVNTTVYPSKGKLYDFRNPNPSKSASVPIDEVITADGWERKRLVVVVNRTLPGPDIIVYEGQRLVVHVTNNLASDSVTVHWHGIHQVGTPFMDGVPFITQCPIAAGQTFTYEFTAYPSGTFWYHSHVGSQRSKGLFGALIVLKNETNRNQEHILQVQEWNHDWDSDYGFEMMLYGIAENRTEFTPSKNVDGSSFSLLKAQSGLFNGRGRYYYDYKNGLHNEAPLTVYRVKQGSTYRFRVIGVGDLYPFRISVDDHLITVISSDGYPVQPVTVESFIINPGERYDFTLVANQTIGNYWIRGKTIETNRVTLAEAILRYDAASEDDPTTKRKECKANDKCKVLNCQSPFYPENEHIQCIFLDDIKSGNINDSAPFVSIGRFSEYFLNFVSEGMVNGKTFKFPSVSAISQPEEITTQCENTKCENTMMMQMCFCTHSISLNKDDTIQMVLSNIGINSGMSHPIHLHGHSFYVLKTGFGRYNETSGQLLSQTEDLVCSGSMPKEMNNCEAVTWSNQSWLKGNVPGLELKSPPRKDTITVPNGGYVVIRIKADNPGLWFMHCHIEFHASHGMGLVLNESFPDIPKVPTGFPTCRNFVKGYSGNAISDEITNEKHYVPETISLSLFWVVTAVLCGVIVVLVLALVLSKRKMQQSKRKFTLVKCHYSSPGK